LDFLSTFNGRSQAHLKGARMSVFLVRCCCCHTHTLTPSVSHLFLLRVCVSCIMQVYFKQTGTLKRVRDSYTNENVKCVCETCACVFKMAFVS